MKLDELLSAIDCLGRDVSSNPDVVDIAYDSRKVCPGSLFVAIPGLTADGAAYVEDARCRGAIAIVCENNTSVAGIPWIRVASARQALGRLARAFWAPDLNKTTMVGITGTNGKTTTAILLHHLLAARLGSTAAWLFGTVIYDLGTRHIDAARTTPESADIFHFINRAETPPRAIVMEVSSHALDLDRVAGFDFDIALWTNLTQDHLDFHHDMETYYEAKKKLFTRYLRPGGCAVINIDDAYGARLAGELDGVRVLTYGRSPQADVRLHASETGWQGSVIELEIDNEKHILKSHLCGAYNFYNITAFAAAARALSFDMAFVRTALAEVGIVPGRMEPVGLSAPFTVVVDYAHTPDALDKVLAAARELTAGRLICVFGCGGNRDRGKRPLMGQSVAAVCDEAIVTSDNPRNEEPRAIIEDIIEGIPLDFPYHVCVDRRAAIRYALKQASPYDCIVIAGKGHETTQEIAGVRYSFDDRIVVREEYQEILKEVTNDA